MRLVQGIVAFGIFVFIAGAARAETRSLTIVEVGFPAANCVFSASCTITVNDSVGHIQMPFLAKERTALLQSRTFTGASGTPAAGLTGYIYRISLTQAAGRGGCLLGFVIDFGPVAKLPYKAGSPPADVFVGSLGGGLGTIGLASAEQSGDIITFTLKSPLCLPESPSNDATTFFIGLASNQRPKAITASVFASGSPPTYSMPARAPAYGDSR